MNFPKENPLLPEDINNTHHNPLIDFLILAIGLLLAVVALSYSISWAAVHVAPKIPLSWEPDLSLSSERYETEQDQRIDDYLQTLTQQLIPDSGPAVQVHWLPELDIANAFATSGRNIHVTRGLLQAVSSENGLAMVLAHEYAHVELRHPLVLMLEQIGQAIIAVFTGFGEMPAGTIAQQGGFVSLMAFNRDMEREADARAVELVERRYGHSEGSAELFTYILDQEEPVGFWGLWQSHPETRERIEFLRSRHHSESAEMLLTPLPDWLLESVEANDQQFAPGIE